MTTAEIKKILLDAASATSDYKLAKDTYEEYKKLISFPKAVSYESIGSKGSKRNASDDNNAKLSEYREKMEESKVKMDRARNNAECLIRLVPVQEQRDVLTRKYINCQNWDKVAESTGYCYRHVTRLHGYALQYLSQHVLECPTLSVI